MDFSGKIKTLGSRLPFDQRNDLLLLVYWVESFSSLQKPGTGKPGLLFRADARVKKDKLDLALWDYVMYVKLELADYFKMDDISDTFIVGSETLLMFNIISYTAIGTTNKNDRIAF